MSIILHPLQHGPEERYAVSSHPGYTHTLQMACSALNTHDVWMVPWVWPYPAPSIWCLPCLTGIMVPFILWDGMLHPLMRPQYRYYTPSLHGVHHAIRCADSPFMACHRVSISPIA